MAEAQVPQISYSNADVTASTRQKQLKTGWMRGRVTDAKAGVSKKSNFMLTITFKPVDAEGNTFSRARATQFLTIPVANPGVEGHTAPETLSFVYQYLCAVDPDNTPRFPKKDQENKGQWLCEDGRVLGSFAEFQDERVKVSEELIKKAVDLFNDPEMVVDDECFIKVEKSGDYRNVKGLRYSEPDDADVIESDFLE